MNPIIFQESDTASDGGWKTTYMKDSSEGIQRQDLIEENQREAIKLRPRVVTKPKKLVNEMPGNIGRPETQLSEYTVRNRPERQPILFQPSSPSTKEFYYAPTDVSAATVSNPLPLPIDFPAEDKTNYGDSDFNLELGPDGYRNVEQDSNFSRKPKTWRFRTKDNDLSLRRRGENLPDLQDVGIKEMVYPLEGGLRPIVFGATPRQRKQKKKINRRRDKKRKEKKAEPKTEQAVVEELAKKVEAPEQEPAKPEPATENKPVKGTSFHMDVEEDDEAAGNGVVVVTDSQTGEQVLRYGISNGKPVMEPTYDESVDGPQWIEAMATVLRNLDDLLPKSVSTNQNLPQPPTEVTDKLKNFKGPRQDSISRSGYRGNVLQDQALEGLNMLEQEKLFTTIRRWEGDSYVITGDRIDAGTKQVLEDKPEGEGKYFSWTYVTPEESKKKAATDVEKEGFTISPGEGVLSVRRLDGWKQVEAEVIKKRRVRPA